MAVPIVFAGSNAKLLNTGNVVNAAGSPIQGLKNYIADSNNASNWATSNGANVNATTDSTPANFPNGMTQLTALKVLRIAGTVDYVRYRFTLDSADYGKKLQIVFDQAYAGAASDYTLQVFSNTASNYGGTSTQLVTPTSAIPAGTFSFNTTFDSPNATAPYIELRIVAVAGTTPLYLNNVTVTPGQVVQGAAVSEWQTYTPTITGSSTNPTLATSGVLSGRWRRVGSSSEIQIYYTQSATTGGANGTGQYLFSLPSGQTIDTNNQLAFNNGGVDGGTDLGSTIRFAGSTYRAVPTTGSATNSIKLYYYNPISSPVVVGAASSTGITDNATTSYQLHFMVPIAEWAGNGTVNLGAGAQVEYASFSGTVDADSNTNGSQTVYGPAGTALGAFTDTRNKYIAWQYAPQSGDLILVQVSEDGTSWTDSSYPFIRNTLSTATQGAAFLLTTANISRFQIGRYADLTTTWTSGQFIRFVKVKPSAPVGFGLATQTATGLVSLPDSAVMCDTGNGYGSTNTRIRRYTNATTTGSAITYADSATLGALFTINVSGVYCLTWTDRSNAAANAVMGFGINSNVTLDIDAQSTAAQMRAITTLTSVNTNYTTSITLRLTTADVIRAQTDSAAQPNSANATVQFSVVLISKT
jgi:hypothetical protein